jgi:MoaA/NifB/PqqE/SkfB family radical SAM enzyme
MAAPPMPAQGVISWNMNTGCNYRCSYCTQRFLDDRGRWARDLPRFLDGFSRLPGAWEIKLSGGEPFVHPHLVELVAGLSARGMRISIVTNLSASAPELEAFLDAAGGNLGVFSASLHLEFVRDGGRQTLAQFLDRCRLVRARLGPGGSLCVTCVATRANLPHLAGLRDRFAAEGVTFKIQPEKQDREVIAYTAAERAQILALGGHNLTGAIAPNFQGAWCWAGARYFILDDRGNAYRCYPARRRKEAFLGNLLDGSFRLALAAQRCPYSYCNCTVPIERGMMSPRDPSPGDPP